MSIFDIALTFGKTESKGQGEVSDKYTIKPGNAPEIINIHTLHGSHSSHSSG